MKFKTQFQETPDAGTKQVFTLPSMTEPDNALSIPEIIAKYTRGIQPVKVYNGLSGVAAPEEEEDRVPDDAALEQILELQAPKPAPEPDPKPAPEPAPKPAPEPDPKPAPTPAPAGA